MDIQQLLAVNVMLISALALAGGILRPDWRDQLLWLTVNAAVVAAGVVLLQWMPDVAGTVAALLFTLLVAAPALLNRMVRARLDHRQMSAALKLANVVAWIHPTRLTRLNAAMIEAQTADSVAAQTAALRALAQRSAPDLQPGIEATALRLEGRWPALLELMERQPKFARSTPGLRIRTLGETGRLDQMARAYDDAKALLHGADIYEAQLFILAFAGRPIETGQLLAGPLASMNADARTYWCAVAERAAGSAADRWRPALERIATGGAGQSIRRAAERLLADTSSEVRPARLDDVSTVIVEECAARLQRQSEPTGRAASWAPVTWLLLAAIAAVYALAEMRGGASNARTLIDLGAMAPSLVIRRGEWWRLVAALFLHWGATHAAINGFMLIVLGRACERMFGSLRMALIYGIGGIGSSASVLWLMVTGWSETAVLVGASGAIMSLFGGLAARSLVAWLRYRDVLDGRNLATLAVIAGLQVAVDLASPNVSLAAHASGFLIGLGVGAALTLAERRGRSTA